MFRIQDEKNYYRFSVNKQLGFRHLVRCSNGRISLLKEDMKGGQIDRKRWYRITITCIGPNISVAMDGETIFKIKDSSVRQGYVAFYTSGAEGAGFDDLEIRSLRRR